MNLYTWVMLCGYIFFGYGVYFCLRLAELQEVILLRSVKLILWRKVHLTIHLTSYCGGCILSKLVNPLFVSRICYECPKKFNIPMWIIMFGISSTQYPQKNLDSYRHRIPLFCGHVIPLHSNLGKYALIYSQLWGCFNYICHELFSLPT